MKRLLVVVIVLLLNACSEESKVTPPPSKVPFFDLVSSSFSPNIQVEMIVSRDMRSLTLSWTGILAENFTACEIEFGAENDCKVIKQGKVAEGAVTLKLGENISLDQMLRNEMDVRFSDKRGREIHVYKINITQDIIDAMIQYVKSAESNLAFHVGAECSVS